MRGKGVCVKSVEEWKGINSYFRFILPLRNSKWSTNVLILNTNSLKPHHQTHKPTTPNGANPYTTEYDDSCSKLSIHFSSFVVENKICFGKTNLVFCVVYCRSLCAHFSFFFWTLCCLSFYYRPLITYSHWYLQSLKLYIQYMHYGSMYFGLLAKMVRIYSLSVMLTSPVMIWSAGLYLNGELC